MANMRSILTQMVMHTEPILSKKRNDNLGESRQNIYLLGEGE